MSVRFAFASHTPLKDYCEVAPAVSESVESAHIDLRNWVDEYQPELVIAIGPDHFNGFFYGLMPSFCVGMSTEAVGDWNTPQGELPSSEELATKLLAYSHRSGVDLAYSHNMRVDHGISQFLHELFEWRMLPPIIPIFVNCAAAPRPPLARVLELGRIIGQFARAQSLRVLVTASGGLSHDPPIPSITTASGKLRERLIKGGDLSAEARQARQEIVVQEAMKQRQGESLRLPLNPEWDRTFINNLQRFDFDSLLSLSDEDITSAAGCGAHEIRAWLTGASAAKECGITKLDLLLYLPIPEWVAGYGIMRGQIMKD
ncbi:MAG: 3-(2,3-dihydroxyphenyl)propionate dioxygenase [Thiotrichales bacterium]|nr:3-(2,3-dihydroxyphenyl)propionate dioxygenase [Thiotrichales bacterium]|tara:strand:- start:2648 stop:3592 length:945 start_codon:yes stop_codon:yes gene_type:complete